MTKIGKIVNTKGLKGEVKILSSSDFKEERFQKGKQLFVNEEKLIIKTCYEYKTFQIVSFKGYDNINDVLKFKNQDVYAIPLDRDVLDENEFFFSELLGMKIMEDSNNIGMVDDVLDYGDKTYLRIKKNNAKKVLFPFNFNFIENVDLKNGIININSIEGLLDD